MNQELIEWIAWCAGAGIVILAWGVFLSLKAIQKPAVTEVSGDDEELDLAELDDVTVYPGSEAATALRKAKNEIIRLRMKILKNDCQKP